MPLARERPTGRCWPRAIASSTTSHVYLGIQLSQLPRIKGGHCLGMGPRLISRRFRSSTQPRGWQQVSLKRQGRLASTCLRRTKCDGGNLPTDVKEAALSASPAAESSAGTKHKTPIGTSSRATGGCLAPRSGGCLRRPPPKSPAATTAVVAVTGESPVTMTYNYGARTGFDIWHGRPPSSTKSGTSSTDFGQSWLGIDQIWRDVDGCWK